MTVQELAKCIQVNLKLIDTFVITGGEPTLYLNQINKVYDLLPSQKCIVDFHLETNGDWAKDEKFDLRKLVMFDYICVSPKDVETAIAVVKKLENTPSEYDIKVVTDGKKVGMNMIKYATMLMPLTTGHAKQDELNKQIVWHMCLDKGIRYSPRLHVDVWGAQSRGK